MHTIKFLIHDKFFFEFFSKCHFLVLVSDFIPIFLIILFVYCICTNIIYCISCHKLFQLYIGDTSQRLSDSLVGHLCCWKNKVVNKIKVWAILFTTFWLKLQFPVLCSFKNVLIIHEENTNSSLPRSQNTSKLLKNSIYGLVFQHTSRCFDTVVKNAFSFCIYYLSMGDFIYNFLVETIPIARKIF